MEVDEILRRLEPWRAKHRKRAFEADIGHCEARVEGDDGGSRVGGEPALAKGERWPMSAGQRLQFLMQLDLSTLPTQRESGLLQVFGGQVRVVHGPVWRRATPRGVHETPEWPIVGWNEIEDLPHPREHESLGVRYRVDAVTGATNVLCEELGLDMSGLDWDVERLIADAHWGPKLLGWPSWEGDAVLPDCPMCRAPMEFFFQLPAALLVGSNEIAHVWRCPRHRECFLVRWSAPGLDPEEEADCENDP